METAFKLLHDQLVDLRPEGASCPEDCQFCAGDFETASANSTDGGSVSDKTYTEAEYDALAAQVEDLKGKVAELTAAAEASEIDARVAEVKAEAEAQVAELQTKLDAAVLEAEAIKTAHEELVALLEKAEADAAEAAELAARRDARIAQVKEVASFPEAYLEENADRFAAMSDDQFELALDAFKAQKEAIASASGKKDEVPAATAMTAARSNEGSTSPLSEVLGLRFQGVDPRNI